VGWCSRTALFLHHVTEEKLLVDYRMRKKTQKLPTVLSQEQVAKSSAPATTSSTSDPDEHLCGRIAASEVAGLKPEHIDSERMLIKVVQGKGGKTAIRCFPPYCWRNCAAITENTGL